MQRLCIHLFLVFFAIAQIIRQQNYSSDISPNQNYAYPNGSKYQTPSSLACFADCQSCQIQNNVCEQCYTPYFVKSPIGSCQLSSQYILESSAQQVLNGDKFVISVESWSNIKAINCPPSPRTQPNVQKKQFFIGNFILVQPLDTNSLTYSRTVGLHDYFTLTFKLITIDWDNTSLLTFQFKNQDNATIVKIPYKYLANIPKQSFCSSTAIDQRVAFALKVMDSTATQIKITLSLQGKGKFGISTWALISGSCNSTCSKCSYSSDPAACLNCNYFLIKGVGNKCSQCRSDFIYKSVMNAINAGSIFIYCQKCPIQFQTCANPRIKCYLPQLGAIINNNCSLNYNGSFYGQITQLNTLNFVGSLYTVNDMTPKSLYIPCGQRGLPSSYTYVGPAQRSERITRIFTNLPFHIQIALSFNVLIIDQAEAVRTTTFNIYFNSQLVLTRAIKSQQMTNMCGNNLNQSFLTFAPTGFYSHSDSKLNLTIVANNQWNIRDVRLIYTICDKSCKKCSPEGCIECSGYFQLSDNKCTSCPLGYGTDANFTDCVRCDASCLNCSYTNISGVVTKFCRNCSSAYFLFQGQCIKKSNYDVPIPVNIPVSNINDTKCGLKSAFNSNLTSVNFSLSKNNINIIQKVNAIHYKVKVQFYLVRVGEWSQNDRLDVYFNDLRVLAKKYAPFGNKICDITLPTTDSVSFESIDFIDYNQTLTLSFQLIPASNKTSPIFGVGNITVYPIGCEQCLTYPFSYKLDYNYDISLNIKIRFNRIYKNNDQTLFKKIFILLLNGNKLDYKIKSNNSIIYNLQAFPQNDIINGNISIICAYPQLIITSTRGQFQTSPFFARLLQQNYTTNKKIDNNATQISILRFSPSKQDNVLRIKTMFQFISRAVIYVGFFAFLLGLQTVCTHFMHNLQKIWLHLFIAALATPGGLRLALSGFSEIQNQNIAINPSSWQSKLSQYQYFDTPSYYTQYTGSVNFFRNIYNIGFAFLILLAYFIIMHIISKNYFRTQIQPNQKQSFKNKIIRHFKVTFHRRPYFYINSLFFYQYLTLVFVSMLQFTSYGQTDIGAANGLAIAGAIVSFLFATFYPIFHYKYIKYRMRQLGTQQRSHYVFINRYQQIFFRFVKKNVWQGKRISYPQRLYNLFRFGEIWWMCLIAIGFSGSQSAQIYLLLLTNAVHMLLILFTSVSRDYVFKMLKTLQLLCFIAIQVIFAVCYSQILTLTPSAFSTLSSIAIVAIIILIILSFIRFLYNLRVLYKQYSYLDRAKHIMNQNKSQIQTITKTQFINNRDDKIRIDQYFQSEEQSEKINIQQEGEDE